MSEAQAIEPAAETPPVDEPGNAEPEMSADTDVTPEGDEANDTAESEQPGGRSGKRIAELTGMNHALSQDRDYWRDQAMRNASAPPAEVEPEPEPEPELAPEPTLDDFDHDVAEFTKAHAKWTKDAIDHGIAQGLKASKQADQEQSAASEAEAKQQARVQTFNDRSAEYAKDHDDFVALAANPNLHISELMTDAILDMEDGPAVVHHLAKHPEDAWRISQKTTPMAVAMALSDISKKVAPAPNDAGDEGEETEGSAQDPGNVSNAPTPPTTVSGGRGGANKLDPKNPEHSDKLSTDEWMKRRRRQVRGNK